MSNCVIIFETDLKPNQLNNSKQILLDFLRKKIGTCDKKHGIIIDFVSIQKIDHKKISHITGNCILSIHALYKVLKPTPGDVYKGLVKAVFKEGIFLDYYGAKILIPSSTLTDWTYINEMFRKTIDGKKHILCVGDWVQVEIKLVQYEHKTYQCIGEFIHS